ncbi:MAG: lysophospholipase [Trueperaceae bacterium]|nr:lysophospholipase [Trueperaceae bacterium]
MRTREETLTSRDGLALPTRAWLPDEPGEARAALVLIHGLGEHVGRYHALATRLTAEGYAVHGYDQRGHGDAEGPRAQVDRFEQLVGDLGDVVARVRAAHPDRPLVLFGHSMGGVVALRAAQSGVVEPDALLLSSPALRVGGDVPGWLQGLLTRVAGPFPDLPTKPVDVSALSRDPAVVEAYRQDPRVYHGAVKARMATELVRVGAAALAAATEAVVGDGHGQPPLLIVHGREDRIADPGASAELHRAMAGRDATLELYDDGPHELFNDPLRERVLGDVLGWLDARLDGRPAGRLGGRPG